MLYSMLIDVEEQMAKKYKPYDEILEIVDLAAGILGFEENDYIRLRNPERELKVFIPVEMDPLKCLRAIEFNIQE